MHFSFALANYMRTIPHHHQHSWNLEERRFNNQRPIKYLFCFEMAPTTRKNWKRFLQIRFSFAMFKVIGWACLPSIPSQSRAFVLGNSICLRLGCQSIGNITRANQAQLPTRVVTSRLDHRYSCLRLNLIQHQADHRHWTSILLLTFKCPQRILLFNNFEAWHSFIRLAQYLEKKFHTKLYFRSFSPDLLSTWIFV